MQKHLIFVLALVILAIGSFSCTFQVQEEEHGEVINQAIRDKDSIQAVELLDSIRSLPTSPPPETQKVDLSSIDLPRN